MADHKLNPLNRGASVIAIFLWPWTLALLKTFGRYAATIFVVAASAILVLLAPSAPLVALISAALLFSIAWHAPLLAKGLLTSIFLFSILTVPYLSILIPYTATVLPEHLQDSTAMVHRLMIWQFAAENILERPLLGWGLDAARILPGGDQELIIGTTHTEGTVIVGQALPLHPHNALIQIWLELGFIGLIFISALFFFLVMAIPKNKTDKPACAIAISVLTAGFVISQLGFGFWQGWWLATLGIAAVLTVASIRPSQIK
jgi:O-antigen ligase